ncbi:MAG TPA: glycosyltransferase [Streptosporangiaceae bacterium]
MAVIRKVSTLQLPALHPILQGMDGVEGWLERDEAALLTMTAAQALTRDPAGAIVEIGSYCGRGTAVLGGVVAAAGSRTSVHAVDTFDGLVGAAGAGLRRLAPTLDRFTANIAAAGLSGVVQVHQGRSGEVELREPIGLLVIDGLHDYASVAADFRRFEPQVTHGGFIAFHDFAEYYPGVLTFVREVLRQGGFEQVAHVGSLIVLRKQPARPTTRTDALARVTGRAPGLPMVSCIMPTYNRRAFVPQAIRHFLDQDYPDRELIVVDDGTDTVEDLIPADPRIRYVRLSRRRTLGAKRNIVCEQARGQILVNWDDDDWIANWRLRYQVSTLLEQDVDVSGLSTVFFCDIQDGKGWRYQYPAGHRPWVHDPTFCYRRELWESAPFPDTSHGIDTRYLWQGRAKRIGSLADPSFYVGIVHPGNTSRKNTSDSWWLPYPVEEIAALMGADWLLYQQAVGGARLAG